MVSPEKPNNSANTTLAFLIASFTKVKRKASSEDATFSQVERMNMARQDNIYDNVHVKTS